MERLKELMAAHHIESQYELAKRISIDYKVVNNWFTGRAKMPREEHLLRVAEFFNVHPAWLRYGDKAYRPTISDDAMHLVEKLAEYGKKNPEGYERAKEILMIMIGDKSGEGENHTVSGGREKETGRHKKKSA